MLRTLYIQSVIFLLIFLPCHHPQRFLLFAFNSNSYKWIAYFRKGFILKMSIMDFHCTCPFLHRHTFVYRRDFIPINWYKIIDRIWSGFYIYSYDATQMLFWISRVFLEAKPFLKWSIQIHSNSNVINVRSVCPQHQTRIGSGSQSWLQRFSSGETLDGSRGGELRWRSRTKASLGTGVDRRHDRWCREITIQLVITSLPTRSFHFVSTSSLNHWSQNRPLPVA